MKKTVTVVIRRDPSTGLLAIDPAATQARVNAAREQGDRKQAAQERTKRARRKSSPDPNR